MAYTTLDYYKNTYLGIATIDDDEITKYIDRASDDIDILTINNIDISVLSESQLTLLKKACCIQTEKYIKDLGDVGSGYDAVRIGSFSMSGIKESKIVEDKALQMLGNAGLLFRGVSCSQYL